MSGSPAGVAVVDAVGGGCCGLLVSEIGVWWVSQIQGFGGGVGWGSTWVLLEKVQRPGGRSSCTSTWALVIIRAASGWCGGQFICVGLCDVKEHHHEYYIN